jgi:hypothetical protein
MLLSSSIYKFNLSKIELSSFFTFFLPLNFPAVRQYWMIRLNSFREITMYVGASRTWDTNMSFVFTFTIKLTWKFARTTDLEPYVQIWKGGSREPICFLRSFVGLSLLSTRTSCFNLLQYCNLNFLRIKFILWHLDSNISERKIKVIHYWMFGHIKHRGRITI